MGNRHDSKGALGDCESRRLTSRYSKTGSARSAALCRMRHRRRTCARLRHLAGGELDQIQFLLGHTSIQTTEQYLGCKQKLRYAVNDKIGIEP
jgi:integrase